MVLPQFLSIASVVVLLASGVARSQFLRNITIDDTDPAIKYTGTWYTSTQEADSYGKGHHYSSQSTAYAMFNFTGVAVYYLMPVYQGYSGGVSTLITLDSGPAQWVNLTRAGTDPTTSTVRWSATGLANVTHTVMISLGRSAKGELATWGEVDGFIYTVADPSPVPTSTSPQSPVPTNVQALPSLQKCPPCGKSKCSFSPQGNATYDTYSLLVGQPVSNCDAGINQTVTLQYSTELELTETWSIDTTIGISYAGLSLQASTGWSKSSSFKVGEQVSMIIPSGKMAALTAIIKYKKTSGNMLIDSGSFDFNSIQPTGVQNYSVKYADCGGLFDAFTFSTEPDSCSSSAAYTTRRSLVLLHLIGVMVLWNTI